MKICHFSTACSDPSPARANYSTTPASPIPCGVLYGTAHFPKVIRCPANDFHTLRNSSALSSGQETVRMSNRKIIDFHFPQAELQLQFLASLSQFSCCEKTFSQLTCCNCGSQSPEFQVMSKLEEEELLLFCTGNKPSLYPSRNQKNRNKLGSSSAATPQNTFTVEIH